MQASCDGLMCTVRLKGANYNTEQAALLRTTHRNQPGYPMTTAKKSPTTAKKAASKSSSSSAAKPASPMKPIKETFGRTTLIAHLAGEADTEPKVVKRVMAALEATILASVHRKGAGSFTLPGLLKISAVQVPAKKKRRGIDPFTKVERDFAAKPASVKLKVRSLKKLKDAAL